MTVSYLGVRWLVALTVLAIAVVLSACTDSPASTPELPVTLATTQTPGPTPVPTSESTPTPTATPTATPSPVPTATPTPTPVPKPTDTPEPTPTPTLGWRPLPPLPPDTAEELKFAFDELPETSSLRLAAPERVQQIGDLVWVKDGLVLSEWYAVKGLIQLAMNAGDVFSELIEEPWVVDGMHHPTMDSLGRLSHDLDALTRVMSHPNTRDGITDGEAAILATLWNLIGDASDLTDRLLNQDGVAIEKGDVYLPLAGATQIIIIHTHRGDADHTAMPMIEEALLTIEEFMASPFPQSPVIFLIDYSDIRYGGSHYGTHIGVYSALYRNFVVHEIAHYYFGGPMVTWISEGAARFFEYDVALREEIPYWVEFCEYSINLSQVESLWSRGLEGRLCRYPMGRRIFLDMYYNLGEAAFLEGFRNLHLRYYTLGDPEDECEGDLIDVCHVEAAFTAGVSGEEARRARDVIDHWYSGSDPQGYDDMHRVQGTIVGPDGEAVPWIDVKLEAVEEWDAEVGRLVWITAGTILRPSDGSIDTRWRNDVTGSAILEVHAYTDCRLVGYYGPGGFTAERELATPIDLAKELTRIEIRLPSAPDKLCAGRR